MGTRAGIFDTMLAVWVRLLAEAAAQQERSPREVRCAKACSEEFKKNAGKTHNQKNKPRRYGIGNAISDSVSVASRLSFSITFFIYISNYSQEYFPRSQ